VELHVAVPIERPYLAVASVLDEGPLSWLPAAGLAPDGHTSELGIGGPDGGVHRRVLVETGRAQASGDGIAVPLSLRAVEHPERYPTLSGLLRLEPAGPASSSLRLDAEYVPPGGRLGAAADRAVMRGVAEASVREFAVRVAERLERGVRFRGRWDPA
jgi:hypothetical protein